MSDLPPPVPLAEEERKDSSGNASKTSTAPPIHVLLSEVQSVQSIVVSLEKAQQQALRQLRERSVSLESLQLRVLAMEKTLRGVREQSSESKHVTTVQGQTPRKLMTASSIASALQYAAKPFGYSHEILYRQLLSTVRAHPFPLARAIAVATVRGSLSREQMDSLAYAIVFDLYGRSAERELLILLVHVLTLLQTAPHPAPAAPNPSVPASSPRARGSIYYLEHNSFATRLLQKFLQLVGDDYLNHTVKHTVHAILTDDQINMDLMRSGAPAPAGSGAPADEDGFVEPGAGNGGNALFLLCGQLVNRVLGSLPIMPFSIRYLAALLDKMAGSSASSSANTTRSAAASTASEPSLSSSSATAPLSPRSTASVSTVSTVSVDAPAHGSLSSVPNPLAPSDPQSAASSPPPVSPVAPRANIVSDFVFLNWIVNAVIFPESHNLAGMYPVSTVSRRNLQAVGTVLIKLIGGSRFTAYQQKHLASLNQFLDEMDPQMQSFLQSLTAVGSIADHFTHSRVAKRSHSPSSAADERDMASESGFHPLALQPNDLFALHAIMRDCYVGPDSAAPSESDLLNPQTTYSKETKLRAPLLKVLTQLGPAGKAFPDARNDYVMLDMGLPSMEDGGPSHPVIDTDSDEDDPTPAHPIAPLPLTRESSASSLASVAPAAEDQDRPAAVQDALNVVTTALAMVASPTFTPGSGAVAEAAQRDLIALLSAEGDRKLLFGDTAKATLLLEAIGLLEQCTPSQLKQDGYRPLLQLQLATLQQRRARLVGGDLARTVILMQGLLDEHTDRLRQRERAVVDSFNSLQIRNLLAATLPKIRALRRYLVRRDAENPPSPTTVVPSSTSPAPGPQGPGLMGQAVGMANPSAMQGRCAGACPVAINQDRLLCAKCDDRLKINLRTLIQFLNKYATDRGATLDAGLILPPAPQGYVAPGVSAPPAGSSYAISAANPPPPPSQSPQPSASPAPAVGTATVSASGGGLSFSYPAGHLCNGGYPIAPQLDLQNPEIASRVSDFVIAATHANLFVHCRAADDSFYQLLEQLKQRFTDFPSFYRAAHEASSGPLPPPTPPPPGVTPNPVSPRKEEKPLPIPHFGPRVLDAVIRELNSVNKATSLVAKLQCFMHARTIINTVLEHTPRLTSIDLSGSKGVPTKAHAGADDYMPVLCYCIMVANPVRFLSNVQFVQVLHPNSMSVKGFVDTIVAVKFLFNLRPRVPPPPPAGSPPSSRSASASPVPAPEGLRQQMEAMGFVEADITAGMHALAAIVKPQDMQQDQGLSKLLDFLTDLSSLREMGYDRDVCVRAILATGHDVPRAVQWIIANQRGPSSSPPPRSGPGPAPTVAAMPFSGPKSPRGLSPRDKF